MGDQSTIFSVTFAFLGPEAAGSVWPGTVGDAGRRLLVALCLRDLPVNLVGQVPKEADAVLDKLGSQRKAQ